LTITVVLAIIVVPGLAAEPIDAETAAKVAFTQSLIMTDRLANSMACTQYFPVDAPTTLCDKVTDELLAYVFDLSPQGFVVVSGDNDLPPVIAYSEHGSFPRDEDPENILLHMLREDLGLRLDAVELTDAEMIEANHDQWEGLLSGDRLYLDPGESWPEVGATWTGGWVESAWHQRSPYNDLCPIDPETGERCAVGCTGTAMAQIVNYWQYPSSITFSEEDSYVTYSRDIEIYAPDASISYIDYNEGNPSDEMCAAISWACGVGAKMDYTSYGSGAGLDEASSSYLKHFNFIHAEFLYCKDKYTQDTVEFYKKMEENIKDSMPTLLWVYSREYKATHAIICDGFRENYASEIEWHLNFGWGYSNSDCWYKLGVYIPYEFTLPFGGILNIEPPTRFVSDTTPKPEVLSYAPNPFRDYVRVLFSIPGHGVFRVNVYDKAGRHVRSLTNQEPADGIQSVIWNGKDNQGNYVKSGVYFIRIDAPTAGISQKVIFYRQNPLDDSIWH
jgi:hypothetical protein